RRHTRCYRDWSSDVCSSDLLDDVLAVVEHNQHVLVSESVHQTREQILRADLQSEGGSKRSGHERRGAERSQVDEPDAMLIIGNRSEERREGKSVDEGRGERG